MRFRAIFLVSALALLAGLLTSGSVLAGTPTAAEPQLISDASLKAITTTIGGASVLPTTRTVPHWWGSTIDPNNGVTYGYNMVGADPTTARARRVDVTIETDITPIIVNIGGATYDGRNVVPGDARTRRSSRPTTTARPTTAATDTAFVARRRAVFFRRTTLAIQLQLEDATMRAQFNKTGASPYHVLLHAECPAAGRRSTSPWNQGIAAPKRARRASSPTSRSAGGPRRSTTSRRRRIPPICRST